MVLRAGCILLTCKLLQSKYSSSLFAIQWKEKYVTGYGEKGDEECRN